MSVWARTMLAVAFIPISGSAMVFAQTVACTAIKSISLPNTRIDNVEVVQSGPVVQDDIGFHPPYPKDWTLPTFCQVVGVVHERKGADGHMYGDHFELRLPVTWNGKLLFQGGGGTDGVLNPALGIVDYKDPPALARGYAVVTTDGGHGNNLDFSHEQQARIDYAYQSIGDVTAIAKQIIAIYYHRSPTHSYFMGCSNGGREAMIATQRYPLEFDGAIAGDPGFDLSHAAIAGAWDTETFNAIAPKDAQNHPILSEAFSNDDLAVLTTAILDKCDHLDGIRDGEINNYAACHFDPEVLVCSGEKTSQCLSRVQVDALKQSFNGAHGSKGVPLYSSWTYDAGLSDVGWRMWKLGTSKTATPNSITATFGALTLKEYFVHPYIPDLDTTHLDYDAIASQVAATAALNDATSTDLNTFAANGGKLILYDGLSDPVFSADDLIAYYNRFARDNGGIDKAGSIARLFLIPGMTHCGGGPATDEFDVLHALELWVEKGEAPQRIVATGKTFPHRTRPLCPYPKYAAYDGSGNSEDAASFACR